MIKLEMIEKGYLTCHSCGSEDELTEIMIGLTERQTVQIRLCVKCAEELSERLKTKNILCASENE
jgi:hypothetical protein